MDVCCLKVISLINIFGHGRSCCSHDGITDFFTQFSRGFVLLSGAAFFLEEVNKPFTSGACCKCY